MTKLGMQQYAAVRYISRISPLLAPRRQIGFRRSGREIVLMSRCHRRTQMTRTSILAMNLILRLFRCHRPCDLHPSSFQRTVCNTIDHLSNKAHDTRGIDDPSAMTARGSWRTNGQLRTCSPETHCGCWGSWSGPMSLQPYHVLDSGARSPLYRHC